MRWCKSHRADPVAKQLADRHYNRQKPHSPQFVPPGSCVVFIADDAKAFWVTSAPKAEFVKHRWAGAWVCSAFRNEGSGTASELIREAVSATKAHYGDPPSLGLITFVDRRKVKPTIVRGKQVWGWTYIKAGFKIVGETKGGLLALQMLPEDMPAAEPAKERTAMTTNLPAPPPEIANRQRRRLLEDASTGLGIPRPAHVSIRGGQFALVRADGARMQLPTTHFDFVVVDVLRETSRVLFPEYQPQSEEPPICYSDNGVGPSYMALQPQSPICETCRWNERGSAQTFTGKDTTACTKSKKLAVIVSGDPQLNIYEFRIGPGSLTNLKAYTAWIGTQANNLDIADFVTRAKWDPQKQFTMVFEAVGWANQNDPTMLQKLEYIETNKLGDAVVNRIDRPADPAMVAQRLQLAGSTASTAALPPPAAPPQFQLPPQAPPAAPAPQTGWQQTAQWQPAQQQIPAPTEPAPAAPKQTRTRKPRGQTPDPVAAGVQAPAQTGGQQAPPPQFSPPGPPNGGFQPPGFVPQVGPGTRLQEPASFNPAPPAPAQPQFGMGQPAAPPSSLADAMNMLPPRQ